jgi:hypothetical protein
VSNPIEAGEPCVGACCRGDAGAEKRVAGAEAEGLGPERVGLVGSRNEADLVNPEKVAAAMDLGVLLCGTSASLLSVVPCSRDVDDSLKFLTLGSGLGRLEERL